MPTSPVTGEFFRSRIYQVNEQRHLWGALASGIPWQKGETRVAHRFMHEASAGVTMPDLELFGKQISRATAPMNTGRPRVQRHIMTRSSASTAP